jgi:predicted negative regulator of RcsB-dependent stress response
MAKSPVDQQKLNEALKQLGEAVKQAKDSVPNTPSKP